MTRFLAFCALCILSLGGTVLRGQTASEPLKLFGYFQNSLMRQSENPGDPAYTSFNLQQLNLFLQRDINRSWRAFINFEILNTFSSSRRWGSFNIEEAWVRYRLDKRFSLKLGLHIPTFNHLTEIKNRTPILPYVIRPLVYETSFSEFIAVEEFTPARAFAQVYGFLPLKEMKLDYAFYLGNSPNISNLDEINPDTGRQSGQDTSETFLFGGRIGLRRGELKVGLSATLDYVNYFRALKGFLPDQGVRFSEIPRVRLGGDLALYLGRFSLEAEFITVTYDDDFPEVSLNKRFYYATLGYQFSEPLFVFISYWLTEQDFPITVPGEGETSRLETVKNDVRVPNIGLAYNLNDRITMKAQFAPVEIENKTDIPFFPQKFNFNHYSMAVSVFF